MDVLMPQLGETVAEGKISKWFVKAGDAVKPGDNLFEIETDKVSMEVPAIAAGVLSAINVAAGEVAPVGAVVAIITGGGEEAAPASAPPKPQTPLTPAKAGVQLFGQELDARFRGHERSVGEAAAPKPPIPMEPFREVRSPERNYGPARLTGGVTVTPLARRLAGEAGIDLAGVKGSGPHGRIIAADVEQARAKAPALAPAAAANIVLTADVEITQSLALVADVPSIELADIVAKAWGLALVRASLDASGIALATGNGRTVIANAANLSLTAIARVRGTPNDATKATTAISIPSVPGITSVTDVLRPPQTTLLSLGAPRRAPVEGADGSVKFVSVMTATLSCDPRALDAAQGAALLAPFKGLVEKPVTMIV